MHGLHRELNTLVVELTVTHLADCRVPSVYLVKLVPHGLDFYRAAPINRVYT